MRTRIPKGASKAEYKAEICIIAGSWGASEARSMAMLSYHAFVVVVALVALHLIPATTALPPRFSLEEVAATQELDHVRNEEDRAWQRTAFHFQPAKNWMNDPNGPLFYKGYYHLFYQYNPYAAVWGNITWGHAVSRDLVRWELLEAALVPDQWYDIKGVWSGSATLVHGKPVMLYTGWSNASTQLQSKAVPKNHEDPLLREWIKVAENPIAVPPRGINTSDFRDPTTAWKGHDGHWRMAVGSKHRANNTGIVLQYRSRDFVHWELLEEPLHAVQGTGMWECPDFFPVAVSGRNGTEKFVKSHRLKYVVKVSLDEKRFDTYVVGSYDPKKELFKPSEEKLDIGSALRYDYGIYYASKTFFDQHKKRRILLGWISEADTATADIAKGWASVQALPRHVWLDESNRNALKQWPVEEVETLRSNSTCEQNLTLEKDAVVEVKTGQGSQLDIEVTFDVSHASNFSSFDESARAGAEGIPTNTLLYCNQSYPAAEEVLGPFGLLVLASHDLQEQTAVFFKLLRFKDGWKALVCNDLTRSSLASDATKAVYGGVVSISQLEKHSLSLRVLVDHSIVETFAQGGKTCITARSYPLLGDDNTAHLFLFNNGTTPVKVKNITVWQMEGVHFPTIS